MERSRGGISFEISQDEIRNVKGKNTTEVILPSESHSSLVCTTLLIVCTWPKKLETIRLVNVIKCFNTT